MLIPLLMLAGLQEPPVVPATSGVLFHDDDRKIDVLYEQSGDQVAFSSNLPVGWSFGISVDVDQNRIWGAGPYDPAVTSDTPDRSFGAMASDGSFCPQMVYRASKKNRDEIYSSSACGGVPSAGYLRVGPVNGHDRAVMSMTIPATEIFAGRGTAHLQVCIWDTVRRQCAYSPRRPFVLPASAAPPTP